ncbi:hypothetical protein J6590_033517 [Homalodisca vitripennis]|nr:hypothetical protein J6590_033517 [Homalodisca vitripennis]
MHGWDLCALSRVFDKVNHTLFYESWRYMMLKEFYSHIENQLIGQCGNAVRRGGKCGAVIWSYSKACNDMFHTIVILPLQPEMPRHNSRLHRYVSIS